MEFAFKSVVSFFVLGICHRQQLNALNHLPSSHIQEYNLGSADFAPLREYLLPVDRRCNQRVFRTNGRPQPWSPEKKKRKLNNFHIMHTHRQREKILCDRVGDRWTFWVKLRAAWICRHRLKWCRPFGSRRVTIWKDDSGALRLHFLFSHERRWLCCRNDQFLPNEDPAVVEWLRSAWPFPPKPDWPYRQMGQLLIVSPPTVYTWINHLTRSSVLDRCASASVMWRVDVDTKVLLNWGSCSNMVLCTLWTFSTIWTET